MASRRRTSRQLAPPPLNARGWRMDGIMAPDRRTPGQQALRQSVRYNAAENADLLVQYEAGARIEDIAAWHQRGIDGVRMQLERLRSPSDPYPHYPRTT